VRAFVAVCRAFGIEPVLMTQPFTSSRNALTPKWAELANQDVFNAIIHEVGRSEDVLVTDLVRSLQEEVPGWNAPGRLFFDGLHITDEGSQVVGAFIGEALHPLPARGAGARPSSLASGGDPDR
jgi:lysophospholipase L1-like esterase